MNRLVLSSPAKLNLFLKVQNKRPDGYHNIVTVFERIDLADELTFMPGPRGRVGITCDHPDVPVGPKNLVHKVARMLQEDLGVECGVNVQIKKRIPVAAGLAGGSSNAATALLGLNRLWGLGLTRAKLLDYARKTGSDVAFFIHDTSFALGTQRGEKIKPININKEYWHILVVPCVKMYSWRVYEGLKLPGRAPEERAKEGHTNLLTNISDNANILIHNLKKGNVLAVSRLMTNDLEAVAVRLSPRLKTLKQRLKLLNAKGVMVSGSGPSVFGLTASREEAAAVRSVISRRFKQVFMVKTL